MSGAVRWFVMGQSDDARGSSWGGQEWARVGCRGVGGRSALTALESSPSSMAADSFEMYGSSSWSEVSATRSCTPCARASRSSRGSTRLATPARASVRKRPHGSIETPVASPAAGSSGRLALPLPTSHARRPALSAVGAGVGKGARPTTQCSADSRTPRRRPHTLRLSESRVIFLKDQRSLSQTHK